MDQDKVLEIESRIDALEFKLRAEERLHQQYRRDLNQAIKIYRLEVTDYYRKSKKIFEDIIAMESDFKIMHGNIDAAVSLASREQTRIEGLTKDLLELVQNHLGYVPSRPLRAGERKVTIIR